MITFDGPFFQTNWLKGHHVYDDMIDPVEDGAMRRAKGLELRSFLEEYVTPGS